MRAVVAATIAICLSGCSLVFVRETTIAEPEPTTWPTCTEHNFWGIADGTVAALALTGVAYFLQSKDSFAPIGAAVEGGIALGFGISAFTGLGKTARCRKLRAAYEKAASEGR